MTLYKNRAGDSGVTAYETGKDFIVIKFIDGTNYLYTNAATGESHIEQMKKLAAQGKGLSTYISQHVKDRYARKF
jgi:hypothetical protein